jgi:hypothetical protein
MHTRGTHLMARALPVGSDPIPIIDSPYSFDDQRVTMLADPIELSQGDTIEINCTYQNSGDTPVAFGQSTNAEMCFAGLLWSPPVLAGTACFND